MLSFLFGSKQAFEVSLADVSQTQLQGTNDVMLEFHADNATGLTSLINRILSSLFLLMHQSIKAKYYTRILCYRSKGLEIMNHGGPQAASAVAAVLQNDDDDVDPHLEEDKK